MPTSIRFEAIGLVRANGCEHQSQFSTKKMQEPKDCRGHALKRSRLAESLPEGSARELFAEMAAMWTRQAIEAENCLLALDQRALPRGNEPYRFGSRIDTNDRRR